MSENKRYGLGALVSPHDPRDYTLARVGQPVLAAFPDEFRLPTPPNAPYDQDIFPMCVGFALALIKSVQEYQERGAWEDYSPGYIYARREPNQYHGDGMYPREALANLTKRGVPPRANFPNMGYYGTLSQQIAPLTDYLDRLALPQKTQTYVSLFSVEEIKTALMTLGPVLFSIPVYDSFYQGGHLPMPDTSRETWQGNHAVAVMGWTKDNRWLICNSWGKEWGPLNGWCTIPFNYPRNEAWSITDLKPVDPTIRLYIGKREYKIGDKTYQMDTEPFLKDNRTFVPIRFIAEGLGCAVDWVDKTKEVIITPPVR